MGQARTFKCINCENEINLYEGIGMMWHSFDKSMFYPPTKDGRLLNFYDEFDRNMIKDIQKFIEKAEDVLVSEAYYQLYICNKCCRLESKIYFKMSDLKTGKIYRLRYICECGGQYRKLQKKDTAKIKCGICGNIMVEDPETHIYWD